MSYDTANDQFIMFLTPGKERESGEGGRERELQISATPTHYSFKGLRPLSNS